jgi:ABC-type uncharacterized transport system ATPase component
VLISEINPHLWFVKSGLHPKLINNIPNKIVHNAQTTAMSLTHPAQLALSARMYVVSIERGGIIANSIKIL